MLSIINPRQTVLVGSRGKTTILGKSQIKDNLMALDWHMPCSFDPFTYAISVNKKSLTLRLIRSSRVFTINFVSKEHKAAVIFCGRHSGEHIDKFEECNLKKLEAQAIDCPRVDQAVGYLECEVEAENDMHDHVIFFARVVKAQLMSSEQRLFHVKENEFTTTLT